MIDLMDGEMRQNLKEVTELDMTPECADSYLPNEHYHSFLKGCDCEMVLKNNPGYGGDYYMVLVNKYCKTHKVMCSKTGWEIGWYQGTKTANIEIPSNKTLTDEQVRDMRNKYDSGISIPEIAIEYKTYYSLVSRVVRRISYKEII